MLRTVLYATAVLAAVVWLPWWTGSLLCLIGLAILRYPIALLVPAIVSDYVYAPHLSGWFFLHNHWSLCIVAVLLIVRYSILAKTRVGLLYS
jgi:hypothetical protein